MPLGVQAQQRIGPTSAVQAHAVGMGRALSEALPEAKAVFDEAERSNVLVGLECGLRGKAQIGKGM